MPATSLVPQAAPAAPAETEPSRQDDPPLIDPLPESVARHAVPWLISLIVHLVTLIWMAVLAVSGTFGGGGLSLQASLSVDEDLLEDSLFAAKTPEVDLNMIVDDVRFEPSEFAEPPPAVSNVSVDDLPPPIETSLLSSMIDPRELMEKAETGPVGGSIDTERVREAESVESATGGVVGEMLGELAEGDLLVAWLFDQSISLDDDRQRVAARLAELFEETKKKRTESGNIFQNAALAFGAGVQTLVPPTDSTDEIVRAVGRVPTDQSGLEHVFSAVAWAARQYTKRWHGRVLIVVWTDESGDDTSRLEETIGLCKAKDISVSIVGPSAILGRQIGLHSWVHAPTGTMFQLEVLRGPDSALPERLILPYWWSTSLPDSGGSAFFRTGGGGGALPPWFGGEQLEGLVSGMGPYALTRLALETGGTYTIFDRPVDRGPFRVERLRPYAPDYRAAEVIASDMRHRALARAVLQAAEITAHSSPARQPSMDFFGNRYASPVAFRSDLKDALKASAAQAAMQLQAVQNALAAFGPEGMEAEYGYEKSPRYRAWYDLTRGRLLAVSVRYAEYINACGLTLPSLAPATNRVTFVPSADLLSGSAARLAAAEAERLLRRCVEEHGETPWAYLAQRELDHPCGLGLEQRVIPPPQNIPTIGPGPARPPSGPRGGGAAPIVTPKL